MPIFPCQIVDYDNGGEAIRGITLMLQSGRYVRNYCWEKQSIVQFDNSFRWYIDANVFSMHGTQTTPRIPF